MLDMLFLVLALTGQAADPLAPARAGKVQCSVPDIEKKTCMGLTTYTVKPDGNFEAVTILTVSPQPLIIMEVRSTGAVKDGAVCGPILASDFEQATFQMNGRPLDKAMADVIRPQILAAIAPLAGKMGCSRETPDGAVLKAEVTVDGVARPEMTQRVLWVSPADGYRVGI